MKYRSYNSEIIIATTLLVDVFNDIIIDNVHIKMGDKYKLEMHIDKSDAEKYGIENGDYIELE